MVLFLEGFVIEVWKLIIEMAPYLLFGFVMAGLLHILIPQRKIYKYLSKPNFGSVVRAALLGVPLPVCSCGVIPLAAHLKKQNASDGSTLSFLVSTPTSGVDSFFATYSLLGPIFAIVRPIAAFTSGIFVGVFSNIISTKSRSKLEDEKFSCNICDISQPHTHTLWEKIRRVFTYAFFDLVEDTGKWLFIGLILGGLITFLIPEAFVGSYLGIPYIAYIVMLLIGTPMYVCATGSIPIAASLVLKGMAPGAALVFLIVGPATNTATLSFVGGKLGVKSLIVYLISIITTALIFGILFDYVLHISVSEILVSMREGFHLPMWIKTLAGIILIALLIRAFISIFKLRRIKGMGKIFQVPDISCKHCATKIENSLKNIDGVLSVNINIPKKLVEVEGDVSTKQIIMAIKNAGYNIKEDNK